MTDDKRQDETTQRDDAALAELLRFSGPRKPVPDDIEARVYARVREAWQETLPAEDGEGRVYHAVRREWQQNAKPRHRRWAAPFALAASVLVALALVLRQAPDVPAPVAVATVVRVAGDAAPAVDSILYAGDRIETGADAGITLRLADAESLRVDAGTTLVIVDRNRFRLDAGRVYADTGDRIYRDRGLVIDTAMGAVTDVGTQFAVAAGVDAVSIAVREGRVDLAHDSVDIVTVAGEHMALERGGVPQISRLAPHDAYWDWVVDLSPGFDIENQSLLDFLRWAARETGRELVFEDTELRLAAMRTDLHGSTGDLAPLDAVESVLATTRFHYRIEDARIVIER